MPRFRCTSLPLIVILAAAAPALAADKTAPIDGPFRITHTRPAWLRDGVVIAGDWATPMARLQQINVCWTQMGYKLNDEQAAAAMREEFSPAMADRLKAKGATLVLLPLWSGMGSEQDERPGMEQTRRFAELVHARDMRVGVYIHEGMLSRGFLAEDPRRYDWLAWPTLESTYKTPPPPESQEEGYPVYRNHPEYQAFMRGMIDYAIKQVKADYLHFDNYDYTSGFSPRVIDDFRAFLRAKYSATELAAHFGGGDLKDVGRLAFAGAGNQVVASSPADDPESGRKPAAAAMSPAALEWQCFQAWVLGESFRKLADYARSLNPQVATEVNASGMGVTFLRPVDLSQLVPNGDAFWYEQAGIGWNPEKNLLVNAIENFKIARLYHQSALVYTANRLNNCESLVFSYDSAGCIYWFLYGRLNWALDSDRSADDQLMPEIRFYREHRDLYNSGDTLADVAVLRGRALNLYGPVDAVQNGYLFEQAMVTRHIPWEIIFDQQLNDLSKYRAVALPDVRMLSDRQIDLLLQYVDRGGNLVATDQTATQDQWGRPRPGGLSRMILTATRASGTTLQHRGAGRIVYLQTARPDPFVNGSIPRNADGLAAAVTEAMNGEPTITADAAPCIGMEFIRQEKRVVVHLLDYSKGATTGRIVLRTSSRLGHVKSARLLAPRQQEISLPTKPLANGVEVSVPAIDFYAVVVLELE